MDKKKLKSNVFVSVFSKKPVFVGFYDLFCMKNKNKRAECTKFSSVYFNTGAEYFRRAKISTFGFGHGVNPFSWKTAECSCNNVKRRQALIIANITRHVVPAALLP